MGAALLVDPIAGFEMFREDRGVRGRFARLAPFPPQSSVAFPPTENLLKMALGMAFGAWETAERRKLWDVAIDPTGRADPHPESGPLPPTP